ncbi:MAG: 1-deoxy-D-xylulose-5-phosphate synthase [Erysipelotrichaceae bacterium]|nr:1-deoxy-D-xylulose-5-phosphate synthase [Erysipelotrichaceae bacterium]MDY5251873.1 1-deoxy-D-xylulose-5-phosphate synthase [Erysipelotrichaceae bacterium]
MNIKEINDPKFLKDLNYQQLNDLALDIRSFLIDSISKTGGHLASNLGVVELTIALHRVFDSPKDKIFFDVGHQSYVHKILTGRAAQFDKLRQYQGLSGFQKRSESVHDVWEAGHSSTSLSAALGMCIARDLDGKDFCVVPVIGDGALSSGMSLEALNEIGEEKRRCVIIFNDNNMSISQNVGALSRSFTHLRSDKSYNQIKENMKRSLSRNDVGKVVLSGLTNFKDHFKESVIDFGIFKQFDIEYLGPINGHNLKELIPALETAKKHDGPIVVHVMTKKGKGYLPCEDDIDGVWHGIGPFNPATGRFLNSTPANCKSWSAIIADDVLRLADQDENILCLTPAMIAGSKLEKFFAKYPFRSFDCGIAEEHAATFAASLALSGKRPFLAIYSSFLQRCYDQINHDICRMDLPVVIGIDRAGLVGNDGDTHHGVFDIGILRPLPNIILSQPKDAQEASDLLYTAFHNDHPFAIRYPRGSINYEPTTMHKITIGTWTKHGNINDHEIIVLTYGDDVDKIAHKVGVNQLKVMVVNCRFFKPLDEAMLKELAQEKKKILIYETDMLAGGLSSAILEYACDNHLDMDIERIGIADNYVGFGANSLLRKEQKIDLNTLFTRINALLTR